MNARPEGMIPRSARLEEGAAPQPPPRRRPPGPACAHIQCGTGFKTVQQRPQSRRAAKAGVAKQASRGLRRLRRALEELMHEWQALVLELLEVAIPRHVLPLQEEPVLLHQPAGRLSARDML